VTFSDYYENVVLDSLFSTTRYIGLSTADPTDDSSGLAEPSGNGYARVTSPASDWTAAAAGSISNAVEITFPTATGSWGTVTHFAIFDAVTGGNILAHGILTESQTITANPSKFLVGALVVTLD